MSHPTQRDPILEQNRQIMVTLENRVKNRGVLIRSRKGSSGPRALWAASLLSLTLLLGACSGTTSGNPFEKSGPPPPEPPVTLRISGFLPPTPEDYASNVKMCVGSIRLYDASNQIVWNQALGQVVQVDSLGTVLAQTAVSLRMVQRVTLHLDAVGVLGRNGQSACSGFDRSIEFSNIHGGVFFSTDSHVLTFTRGNADFVPDSSLEALFLDLGMERLMLRLGSVESSDEISQALRELNSSLSFMLGDTQAPGQGLTANPPPAVD